MIRLHEGKSNNSRDVTSVVQATNTPTVVANDGRYDLGREGYLFKTEMEPGRAYNVHKIL